MNNNENIEVLDEKGSFYSEPTKKVAKRKKGIFKLILGFLILAIVIVGGFFLSSLIKFEAKKDKTFAHSQFKFLYSNKNFDLSDEENVLLNYKSDEGQMILLGLSNLSAAGLKVDTVTDRTATYSAFLSQWGITNQSGSLLALNDDLYYASTSYKVDGAVRGYIYSVYSKEMDKMVTFKSYTTINDKVDVLNKEILSILKTLTFNEANSAVFEPGTTKKYDETGYMEYTVPEQWSTSDFFENEGINVSRNFSYMDNHSKLSIKASKPYDPSTYEIGITYDEVMAPLITKYGVGNYTETIVKNSGVEWTMIKSNTYNSTALGGNFHDEVYFFISENSYVLHMIEFKVYEGGSELDKAILNDSITYIMGTFHIVNG